MGSTMKLVRCLSHEMTPLGLVLTWFIIAAWKAKRERWEEMIEFVSTRVKEEADEPKEFNPKNKNIPVLETYSDELGDEYWSKWEKMQYEPENNKSWIKPEELKKEAERLGMTEKLKLEEIVKTLEAGANLEVKGEGRWSSRGRNNPSTLEYGARLADSLQSAIKDGFMWGPLTEEEMPWEAFKVSPMTVRLKPNGAARIIVNLSWPHEGRLGEGKPISVNKGMEEWEEFEATKMTSDYRWREALYRAGCPSEMVKNDWNAAYK